jgi:hypothetical protein
MENRCTNRRKREDLVCRGKDSVAVRQHGGREIGDALALEPVSD